MSRRRSIAVALLLAGGLLSVLAAGGCGVKIALPKAEGLFSVSAWIQDEDYDCGNARQFALSSGRLFVVSADSLSKRGTGFALSAQVGGLTDATAVCVDPLDEVIFVWDQGTHELHWYNATDLALLGTASLPDVGHVRTMAANARGIDQVPGARTFLYLADDAAGLVRRYSFDDFNGVEPFGILCHSIGESARSIHEPWGMTTDADGMLLVCDADTARNWVVRFDPTPDVTDVVTSGGVELPYRGTATVYALTTSCDPPAMVDYTLGYAAGCNQSDWVGHTSAAPMEFTRPTAVSIDGSGRIFVADTGNNRIQLFNSVGEYALLFGGEENSAPSSLATIDKPRGGGQTAYGAYVFVLMPNAGIVRRYISTEYYVDLYGNNPKPTH